MLNVKKNSSNNSDGKHFSAEYIILLQVNFNNNTQFMCINMSS